MKVFTFSFDDRCKSCEEYSGFLELRKRVLVDNLGWDLSVSGAQESDQYDNPTAIYSVVTLNGRVIAGARAAPCNASWGGWSYMLNDAHFGRIPGIPSDLLATYPKDGSVWECTRFVSDEAYSTNAERLLATRLVVAGLCSLSGSLGATRLISLSPAALGRLLRSFGYQVDVAGKSYVCAEDDRRYRPFAMVCDVDVNYDLLAAHSPDSGKCVPRKPCVRPVKPELEQFGVS